MSNYPTPRLDYLDKFALLDNLPKFQQGMAERQRELDTLLPQRQQYAASSLASSYKHLAASQFAVGEPLTLVKENLRNSAKWTLRVFELRGTAYAAIVSKPIYSKENPGEILEEKVLTPPDARDYSATNSRKGYQGIYNSLVGGDYETDRQIAALIWDPPDADYIHKFSPHVCCTPNDQHHAYALREYYAGNTTEAVAHLKKVRTGTTPKNEMVLGFQAKMLLAILTKDLQLFVDNLIPLLDWHEQNAKRKPNHDASEFYLCLPALGLSVLALHSGLCQVDNLPPYYIHFPLELLS